MEKPVPDGWSGLVRFTEHTPPHLPPTPKMNKPKCTTYIRCLVERKKEFHEIHTGALTPTMSLTLLFPFFPVVKDSGGSAGQLFVGKKVSSGAACRFENEIFNGFWWILSKKILNRPKMGILVSFGVPKYFSVLRASQEKNFH